MEEMAVGIKKANEAIPIHTNWIDACFLLQRFQIKCKSKWTGNILGVSQATVGSTEYYGYIYFTGQGMDTDRKLVQESCEKTRLFIISWTLILPKYFFKLEPLPV